MLRKVAHLRQTFNVYSVARRSLIPAFGVCTTRHVEERWESIDGFSKYEVSSMGRIRAKKTKRLRFIDYDRFKKLKHPAQCKIVADHGTDKTFLVHRLVLIAFDPRPDQNELCACHMDGDTYNNKLENLEWREKREVITNSKGPKSKMIMTKGDKLWEFESAEECKDYLISKGVKCRYSMVSYWCRHRRKMHGFAFRYKDSSKYQLIVPNLDGEQWRLFEISRSKFKVQYLISSMGRMKSVKQSGKEKLVSVHIVNGYSRVGVSSLTETFVHRIEAKAFVSNPMDYDMVDHIDGNRTNNASYNLRWVANNKQNYQNPISRRRLSLARQDKRKIVQLKADGTIVRTWDRAFLVKQTLGLISTKGILNCCRGQQRKSAGYIWKFADSHQMR